MENIHLFNSSILQEDYINNYYTEPYVGYCMETDELSFNDERLKYKLLYLTFEAIEDCVFTCTIDQDYGGENFDLDITSISYSLDNGENWTTTLRTPSSTTIITTPTVIAGNKVLWKGISTKLGVGYGQANATKFSSTGRYNICGNINSLCYEDNFINHTESVECGKLFCNSLNLISAKYLILPAITLVNYCYQSMFSGCTSLTTAPELPATTLSESCYDSMFHGCTSLTTAPELPATTLALYCYASMFLSCTSLTKAPLLPATTLALNCYNLMFSGCTSLIKAPELPATTLALYCYASMFLSCTSLTIAPELPATTLAEYCYSNMFLNCTNLMIAPVLPATELANSCYSFMFLDCSKLNYIKYMALDMSELFSPSWVIGVAPSGTFIMNPEATYDLIYDTTHIPEGWNIRGREAYGDYYYSEDGVGTFDAVKQPETI